MIYEDQRKVLTQMQNITIKHIERYDVDATEREKNDIWAILCNTNTEFIPPLSSRKSINQQDFVGLTLDVAPTRYYLGLQTQEWLLALDGSQVLGFLSFYRTLGNTIYISTVIVDPWHRGKKIGEALYEYVQKFSWWERLRIRTWSTNNAHINLLKKMGFHSTLVIQDDRGTGINTIYFEKLRDIENPEG
jgi:ribosomal protein S18 acetylase RimI-like enzyme